MQIECSPIVMMVHQGRFVLGIDRSSDVHADVHRLRLSPRRASQPACTTGAAATSMNYDADAWGSGGIMATDRVYITNITLDGGPDVERIGDEGFAFPSDYRRNVTFRATNLLGLTHSCQSEVTTFSAAKAWDPSVMELKSETTPTGGSSQADPRDSASRNDLPRDSAGSTASKPLVYYANSSYTVDGPESHGWGKETLFVGVGVGDSLTNTSVGFKTKVRPPTRGIIFVDQEHGSVIIAPKAEHMGREFTVELLGVLNGRIGGGAEALVKRWTFVVKKRPQFVIREWESAPARSNAAITNTKERVQRPFEVGQPFQFAPITLTNTTADTTCTFTITGNATDDSIYINPKTGEVQGLVDSEQTYVPLPLSPVCSYPVFVHLLRGSFSVRLRTKELVATGESVYSGVAFDCIRCVHCLLGRAWKLPLIHARPPPKETNKKRPLSLLCWVARLLDYSHLHAHARTGIV